MSASILYFVSALAIVSCTMAYLMGVRVLAMYREHVIKIPCRDIISIKKFKENYFVRQIWLIMVLNTISLIFVVLVFGDLHQIENMAHAFSTNKFFWWKVFDSFLAFGYGLIYLDKLYDKRARF